MLRTFPYSYGSQLFYNYSKHIFHRPNSSCMCGGSSSSKTVGLLDHLCTPMPSTSARKQKIGTNSAPPKGIKQVLGQVLKAAYVPKGSTLSQQASYM